MRVTGQFARNFWGPYGSPKISKSAFGRDYNEIEYKSRLAFSVGSLGWLSRLAQTEPMYQNDSEPKRYMAGKRTFFCTYITGTVAANLAQRRDKIYILGPGPRSPDFRCPNFWCPAANWPPKINGSDPILYMPGKRKSFSTYICRTVAANLAQRRDKIYIHEPWTPDFRCPTRKK